MTALVTTTAAVRIPWYFSERYSHMRLADMPPQMAANGVCMVSRIAMCTLVAYRVFIVIVMIVDLIMSSIVTGSSGHSPRTGGLVKQKSTPCWGWGRV